MKITRRAALAGSLALGVPRSSLTKRELELLAMANPESEVDADTYRRTRVASDEDTVLLEGLERRGLITLTPCDRPDLGISRFAAWSDAGREHLRSIGVLA